MLPSYLNPFFFIVQKECAWAIDRLKKCCQKMGKDSLHCSFPGARDDRPGAETAAEPKPQTQPSERQEEQQHGGQPPDQSAASSSSSKAGGGAGQATQNGAGDAAQAEVSVQQRTPPVAEMLQGSP